MNWTFFQMNHFWFDIWPFDFIYRLEHVFVPGASANGVYEQNFEQICCLNSDYQSRNGI
jgi:hypothetical protein